MHVPTKPRNKTGPCGQTSSLQDRHFLQSSTMFSWLPPWHVDRLQLHLPCPLQKEGGKSTTQASVVIHGLHNTDGPSGQPHQQR